MRAKKREKASLEGRKERTLRVNGCLGLSQEMGHHTPPFFSQQPTNARFPINKEEKGVNQAHFLCNFSLVPISPLPDFPLSASFIVFSLFAPGGGGGFSCMRRWVGVDLKIFSSDPLLLFLCTKQQHTSPICPNKEGRVRWKERRGGENECREEEEEAKKGERQTRTPFSHLEI